MADRHVVIAWTTSSIIPDDGKVTVAVMAKPWAPEWLAIRKARSWFTVDPGSPKFVKRVPTDADPRSVRWEFTWAENAK